MKSFKRIVKDALLSTVNTNLDVFQFPYWSGQGVDVLGTLFNMILSHVEGSKMLAWLVFLISSSFKCIQTYILSGYRAATSTMKMFYSCFVVFFYLLVRLVRPDYPASSKCARS